MPQNDKLTRREAREVAFGLIFEAEYHSEEDLTEVYKTALDAREIPKNKYVKTVFFGVYEKLAEIDALIEKNSIGWRTDRLSKVSRAILRLAVYEFLYMEDIPDNVTLNEAIELSKKFDDERARPFINGILNAVKDELQNKASDENEQ